MLMLFKTINTDMNLEQFVKKFKSQSEAGKALGLSQGMISHRLNNRYKMTPNAALDLEKRSNGEMSRFDLLPSVFIKETDDVS